MNIVIVSGDNGDGGRGELTMNINVRSLWRSLSSLWSVVMVAVRTYWVTDKCRHHVLAVVLDCGGRGRHQ